MEYLGFFIVEANFEAAVSATDSAASVLQSETDRHRRCRGVLALQQRIQPVTFITEQYVSIALPSHALWL